MEANAISMRQSPATLPAEENRGSMPAPQPQAQPKAGRDARGGFTPGNPGGRGNPFARQVAQLRSAFLQWVTPKTPWFFQNK